MNSDRDPRALVARRRAHIHALRTRVATVAVAAFLALWAGLFVQLATGHDPALKDSATTAVVQSADPAATDTADDGSLTGADTTSDGVSATPSDSSSDVTTRQS